MKNFAFGVVLMAAASLWAQPKPTLSCEDRDRGNRHNRLASHCEMREQTVASAGGVIAVDARQNGGIAIKGWDRADVLVRSQVWTAAATEAEAQDLGRQVTIQTAGVQIRANGPAHDRDHEWSVSFEVFVPARSSVSLETVNGGISIADVTGDIAFTGVNGGVALKRVGGNVHGSTTNGGVSIQLAGERWDGSGLDVSTTNGGVSLSVPQNYSANVDAGTMNGGIHSDLPITTQGRRDRHISATLGTGGPTLRISTTNGGVSIKRI
jgi:DUF4097 and DUF4098 domain-containing protein YvlB